MEQDKIQTWDGQGTLKHYKECILGDAEAVFSQGQAVFVLFGKIARHPSGKEYLAVDEATVVRMEGDVVVVTINSDEHGEEVPFQKRCD